MAKEVSRNRDSIVLSEAGRKRLKRLMDRHAYSIAALAHEAETGENQVKKALDGRAIDRKTVWKLAKVFHAEAVDLIDARDWQVYCTQRARAYLQLTTSPILSREGAAPNWQEYQIDVELELRQQQLPLKRTSYSLQEGSDLFTLSPDEVIHTDSIPAFLERIFKADNLRTAQRIAVTGPLGAGKTNCLQRMIAWLLSHPQYGIPIWIPAAALQASTTVEDYLRTNWLAGERVSGLDWEEFLIELTEGRIWLFLDAVDECGGNAMSSLASLKVQLTKWLTHAHLVISCRGTVWDLESNPLRPQFNVYCIKPLHYGNSAQTDQVQEFINVRFRHNPKQGVQLRHRLERSENRSLKNLVRNPFCLELLCYLWQIWQRSPNRLRWNRLPQTRFELYEWYVHYLVDVWRPQSGSRELQFSPILLAIQVLALRALLEERSPFRIRHAFILEVWQSEGFDPDWLELLKQNGILSLIGHAQENAAEDVYSFLHPVFQSYFAARAVERHQVLFDPCGEPGTYVALELHFWEVVLLYLERPLSSSSILSSDKEALLQALSEFNDQFSGFYTFRARLLAATGINCYERFTQKEKVVDSIACWSCRILDPNQSEFLTLSPGYIEKYATQALLETDAVQALASLKKLLKKTPQQTVETHLRIIDRLLQIEGGKQIAFREIRYLSQQSLMTQLQLLPVLHKFFRIYEPDDTESMNQIKSVLLSNTQDESNVAILRLQATLSLREIDFEHPAIAETLAQLRSASNQEVVQVARVLHQWLVDGNPSVQNLLYGEDGYYRYYSLEEIDVLLAESNHQLRSQSIIAAEVLTQLAMAIKTDGNFRVTFQGERLIRLFSIFKRIIRNYNAASGQDEIRLTSSLLTCFELINICSEQLPYPQVFSAWLTATS